MKKYFINEKTNKNHSINDLLILKNKINVKPKNNDNVPENEKKLIKKIILYCFLKKL